MYTRNAFTPTLSDSADISPKRSFAFLYVGGAGNVKVTTVGGDTPTFTAVPAGTILGGSVPLAITRVWLTGTTATNLVVLHSDNPTT